MRLVTSLSRLRVTHFVVILALLLMALPMAAAPVSAVSNTVVISQIYGGGGNNDAVYTNDFIELFNRGTTAVDLNGWSVQYAAYNGTSWGNRINLVGSIAPGGYYLIEGAAGTNSTPGPLPAPDISSKINLSGTKGKVALVNSTSALTGSCPTGVVDFVGFGASDCFEGSGPTAVLSNNTAALRNSNGCTDTDNNAADFAAGAPAPRNSASPANICVALTQPALSINDIAANEGNSGTTEFTFTVSLTEAAGAGGVTFDIATTDGTATSTAPTDDFVANSVVGATIPEGGTEYKFTVTVNGDTVYEPDETFTVNVTKIAGATDGDTSGQGTILNDESACGQPFTPIYAIQGSDPAAAITGDVTTEGVVVGDFEGNSSAGLGGFYLQDASGDGDPATSDGIFVYDGTANKVSAGQIVRVTGKAADYKDQTQISSSKIVTCDGTVDVQPVDVTLPFASATEAEKYEGMLVRLPQPLVISEYFDYDRYGEIVLGLPLDGEARLYTPTAVEEPGAAAQARAALNSLRMITLDDGINVQNPAVLRHPNGEPFSPTNQFRGGDTVQNTVGVLGYSFGMYLIEPTRPADYTPVNPRPAAPEPVGGNLHVAAMNTLNFFITADYPSGDPLDNKCGPLQNVECRGWDSDQPDEFTRQRTKLLQALAGLDADVIGLNEMENTPGVEPLADIVSGLNELLGAGTYAYIDTGVIGTDAIRVGMIYKPGKVTPVGDFKTLDSAVDPRFLDTRNRPSLAQTFEENATGARFTLAVNHFKSKGSACDGDPDTGDGQGNCNQTRKAAAQALVDWLATDPTGSGDADYLIMGDLNSYAMEDPIKAILAGPDDTAGTGDDYTNLVMKYQGRYAYSYVFDGQTGYLDQALASSGLATQITGAADWHINADESDVLDYDTSYKPADQKALYEPNAYRTSDHDPVMVGLKLNAPEVAAPKVMREPSTEKMPVVAAADFRVSYQGFDPYTCTVDYGDGSGPLAGLVRGKKCLGPLHTYSTYGEYPVTITVMDKQGVRGSSSTVHTVIFDFHGFFGWVHNAPYMNTVNSGRAVPFIFTLGGDKGLDIFSTPPTVQVINCRTGQATGDPAEVAGSLTYNPYTKSYTYAWKTDKTWKGTCRQLQMTLVDGTTHKANFFFTR